MFPCQWLQPTYSKNCNYVLQFEKTFEEKLMSVVEERYGAPGQEGITEAWDDLQTEVGG